MSWMLTALVVWCVSQQIEIFILRRDYNQNGVRVDKQINELLRRSLGGEIEFRDGSKRAALLQDVQE